MNIEKNGKIITFYSYKGGVGRSMAMSNIACILSKLGKKILIIDFDLEASGVEKYFSEKHFFWNKKVEESLGLVDLLNSWQEGIEELDWKNCINQVRSIVNIITIDLISAGKKDDNFTIKVQSLNWDSLFSSHSLANKLEDLRISMKRDYDFILVDSRTGISDIGGICSIYLPDIVVFFFTTNASSFEGCINVMNKAKLKRKLLPYDRNLLTTLPILAKDESKSEYAISLKWKEKFINELSPFFADWLPENSYREKKMAIELLKIPYVPYWSFGEKLPIIEEGSINGTIGFSYEKVATLIYSDFDWEKVKTGFNLNDIDQINENTENILKIKAFEDNFFITTTTFVVILFFILLFLSIYTYYNSFKS